MSHYGRATMRPYYDTRQIGGTRSMRNLFQMFGEFHRHAPPRHRKWGWSRRITTAELAARGWQL